MSRRWWGGLALIVALGAAWLARRPAETPAEAALEARPDPERDVRPVPSAATMRAVEEARQARARPEPQATVPEPGTIDTGVTALAEEKGHLTLNVYDDRGRPVDKAWVLGDDCPLRYVVTEGGGDDWVPPMACELIAVRMDGALPTRSDPVWVDIEAGDEVEVDLVLPSERTGGIGIWIEEHDEGVLVTGVVPGTPAWLAGLEAGDLIVEVDGTPAAWLSLDEFQQVMTGAEGTEVRFVIAYEADEGFVEEELLATREYLEQPRRW